jgi:hypothetical protein
MVGYHLPSSLFPPYCPVNGRSRFGLGIAGVILSQAAVFACHVSLCRHLVRRYGILVAANANGRAPLILWQTCHLKTLFFRHLLATIFCHC